MFILTTYNICFNSPGSSFEYIGWGCSSIFFLWFQFWVVCFISVTFVPGIEIEGGGERGLRCSSKGKQLKKLKEEGSGWGEIGL